MVICIRKTLEEIKHAQLKMIEDNALQLTGLVHHKKLQRRILRKIWKKHDQKVKSTIVKPMENQSLIRHTLEGRSLFCMGPNNSFRKFIFHFVENKCFKRVVLMLIVISTITLALESPLDDP